MGFLKENLFLVLLAAAVAVVGGTLLAIASTVGGEVEDELTKRQAVAAKLRRRERGARVNQEIVAAEKRRVQTTRSDANNVQLRCIRWNRRNCKPLRLPLLDKNARVVGRVDAFPIDQKTYLDYSLRYQFTHEYLGAIEALRRKLRPATLPSEEELAAATEKWRDHIEREAELREAGEGEEKPAGGEHAAETPARRARLARIGPAEPGAPSLRGPGKAPTDAADKAKVYARRELMKQHARKGWTYADESAFQKVFVIAITGATDQQLWSAQLNLWVTSDIVEAIVATNMEAFGGLPESGRDVTTAAVKRLLRIEVANDYFTGRAAPGAGGGPTPAFGPSPRAGLRPFGSPSLRAFRPAAAEEGKGLTGRTVCKDYDVLHYSFSVIMSARHLLSLQKNLMRRNLHTILRVQMQEVPFDEAELYYYGTEPVVQVSMDCELLLLTAWERGTEQRAGPAAPAARGSATGRVAGAIRWKKEFPPLMPLEVLSRIGRLAPDALRDVDRRRLEESPRP